MSQRTLGELENKVLLKNVWWQSEKIPESLLSGKRHPVFKKIIEKLDSKKILTLSGPRGVGKTNLIYSTISHLLEKTDPGRILYICFDELVYVTPNDLKELYEWYAKKFLKDIKNPRTYIFLDGLHLVEDWDTTLKLIYNLNINAKFIVSWSAPMKMGERYWEVLLDKIDDIPVRPRSFRGVLHSQGIESGIKVCKDDLERTYLGIADDRKTCLKSLFEKYLEYGGFPGSWEDSRETRVFSGTLKKTIFEDMTCAYNLRGPQHALRVLKYLGENLGRPFDLRTAALDLNLKRDTVTYYLEYLKETHLIFFCDEIKKKSELQKIYLCDPALYNALIGSLDKKKIVENTLYLHLRRHKPKHIENSNGTCFIVKSAKGNSLFDSWCGRKPPLWNTQGFFDLMEDHDCTHYTIITDNTLKTEKKDMLQIDHIPAWLYFTALHTP